MRIGFLGVLFSFCVISAHGQDNTVSELRAQLAEAKSDSARIFLMTDLADELKNKGNVQDARDWLFKAQKLAQNYDKQKFAEVVTVDLADYYLTTDQPDSAAVFIQDYLEQFPKDGREVKVLNLLATIYRAQAKYEKSIAVYEEARSLVDSADNPQAIGAINQNMALVYKNMGDMGAAFKYYQEGLEAAKSSKDSVFLATVLNNLGEAYNTKPDFEQAKFYLERSAEVCKKIGYKVGLQRALGNLANTEKGLGNFEAALKLYKQVLKVHRQIKPDTPPFRITYNLGDLYFQKGNLEQANEKFRASLEFSKQMGIPQGLYYNYTGLGDVAKQRDNISTAANYYRQALDVAEKLRMAAASQETSKTLYELYKKSGDFKQALQFLERNKTISDSLNKLANEQRLAETENQLKLRKEEEVNRILREKQEEQQARLTTQKWLIAASVAIIIVILISLYLLYKSNQEKKRINEELEKRQTELEELNGVKDKILAIISHDLRSPLASMQGMLYLLREDDLAEEEIEEMTTKLEVSLNQNLSMMDNLLVWARGQMSGLAIDLVPVNAHEIVKEVLENFEFQANHKQITLRNDVPVELQVQADSNLLKLIYRNLVSNAIKFSEEGDEITIAAREVEGEIIFEVRDTGIGIPEEKQANIFSFDSGSRDGTKNEKGSGLGLQLCKEFTEKQNGEIYLESTVGKGSTFYVSLPKVG